MVEMKRNPQGSVDKRIRATLRPMSKNRRDSSVCELEQRLRDVKTNNCRFRKALMEKEAELQVKIWFKHRWGISNSLMGISFTTRH